MSLVDYPSSDDEEILEVEVREQIPNPPPQNQGVVLASSQAPERIEPQTVPPSLTLPDASLLLNSTPFSSSSLFSNRDHSSRVASALAENASRKRRSNGSSSAPSILNCNKLPRGTLRHSKNVPETVGGLLVPPQLTGRSNIVTEDVSKLFVKRHAGPESH